MRQFSRDRNEKSDLISHVISIRAVSRTREGGRQRRFSVLTIVGNGNGHVGYGSGKAANVGDAIKKAERKAQKNMFRIQVRNGSVPYDVFHRHCKTSVIIRRAKPGTGLNSNNISRKIFEVVGFEDLVCKCIGNSKAPHNIVKSTMEALRKLGSVNDIAKRLGKDVNEILKRDTNQRSFRIVSGKSISQENSTVSAVENNMEK